VTKRRGGNQVIPRPDSWRLGEVPSWIDNPHLIPLPEVSVLADRVVRRVVSVENLSSELSQEWVSSARSSAVLVALVDTESGPSFILTKRADHLKNHRGEVSFPGGRVEEAESVHAAALRESEEEIGLAPQHVRLAGELDPLTTFVSNSVIVPVVGVVNSIAGLCINPDEVSKVLVVPIVDLLHSETYHNEWWLTPRGDMNIHFFDLDDETIWGATARIIRQFIEVAVMQTE
jgi:8-oxo-dGTP pyrophosphatase MutT (NUDIX family)